MTTQRNHTIMRYVRFGTKGHYLGSFAAAGLALVLLGVTLAMGAYINNSIKVAAGFNETAADTGSVIIANSTLGIYNISSWIPIIAIVIAAGGVVGVLIAAFRFGSGND